jgi:hypothetical protein
MKMPVSFTDVQTILNQAIAAWRTAHNGNDPDLSGHNTGAAPMVWGSKAELLAAIGKGRRLIDPAVIGNGKGKDANLVIDLKVGFGNPPRRMPLGGPYVSDPDIDTIIAWIDAGCPD